MKRYLVIGNPIQHSLSPKLHNYWLKKNKIDAIYEKNSSMTIQFVITKFNQECARNKNNKNNLMY